MTLKPQHIKLLMLLKQANETNGEQKYLPFRKECNPWRKESYFDGQITWLRKKGLLEVRGTKDKRIQISPAGLKLIEELWS